MQCSDMRVLDSLASEVGDGTALTRQHARSLRRAARRLALRTSCARVRDSAEELAFDLATWLAQDAE